MSVTLPDTARTLPRAVPTISRSEQIIDLPSGGSDDLFDVQIVVFHQIHTMHFQARMLPPPSGPLRSGFCSAMVYAAGATAPSLALANGAGKTSACTMMDAGGYGPRVETPWGEAQSAECTLLFHLSLSPVGRDLFTSARKSDRDRVWGRLRDLLLRIHTLEDKICHQLRSDWSCEIGPAQRIVVEAKSYQEERGLRWLDRIMDPGAFLHPILTLEAEHVFDVRGQDVSPPSHHAGFPGAQVLELYLGAGPRLLSGPDIYPAIACYPGEDSPEDAGDTDHLPAGGVLGLFLGKGSRAFASARRRLRDHPDAR